jgi:hypothetical protein
MVVQIAHWGILGNAADLDDPYPDVGWPDCVLVPGDIPEPLD